MFINNIAGASIPKLGSVSLENIVTHVLSKLYFVTFTAQISIYFNQNIEKLHVL